MQLFKLLHHNISPSYLQELFITLLEETHTDCVLRVRCYILGSRVNNSGESIQL